MPPAMDAGVPLAPAKLPEVPLRLACAARNRLWCLKALAVLLRP